MFIRVVRFTDVDRDRLESRLAEIGDADGPPEGVDATGVQFLLDEQQGTAIVLQHFATREAMEEGAKVLSAMDPGDTPGTRVSVDACEVKIELGR